jgi:ADP-heptose:LPS heptosyltransferase
MDKKVVGVREPSVLYPSAGIGDHLLALPALRALAHIFPNMIDLVCVPRANDVFFTGLPLRNVFEVRTLDYRGGGIVLNTAPGHEPSFVPASIQFTPETAGSAFQPWSFEAADVAKKLKRSDLLISLSLWHSSVVNELVELLQPRHTIGFCPAFSTPISPAPCHHAADSFFACAKAVDESLSIEDFTGRLILDNRFYDKAKVIKDFIAPESRLLVVHADSVKFKMWPAHKLIQALNAFLELHDDFVVAVVGARNLELDRGKHQKRIFECFPLELQTAFALVASADLFLGIDSCMLHCADISSVPGVGLFGPTDPRRWGFRFSPHRHVRSEGAVDSIEVMEVVEALEVLHQEN